ncbi:MAG: DUF1062 domain-containing protein [Catenulispora sp.]|nr:DUF1062 domain-containing protein [Catenulispora sp.]
MRAASQWRVRPNALPAIRRRCRASCPSTEFRTHGKFRVNANHKLLDIWLLAQCADCGDTVKLTVLERTHVRSIDPDALEAFHGNSVAHAARLLTDPRVAQRNGITLDWADAWSVDMEPAELPKADILDVSVHFTHRIPLRTTTVIATGLGLTRGEVIRHIEAGRLTSEQKLSGRAARDFSFVLRWE